MEEYVLRSIAWFGSSEGRVDRDLVFWDVGERTGGVGVWRIIVTGKQIGRAHV